MAAQRDDVCGPKIAAAVKATAPIQICIPKPLFAEGKAVH